MEPEELDTKELARRTAVDVTSKHVFVLSGSDLWMRVGADHFALVPPDPPTPVGQ